MAELPLKLDAKACRGQAVACRVVAQKTMTSAHRIMLEHIAETWLRIGADITKAGRRPPARRPAKRRRRRGPAAPPAGGAFP
jgi:ActR/RegA family two-component response regulator